jgi:hypothetical protein
MKLNEIWQAIDKGDTVCWYNELYQVKAVDSNGSKYAKVTERNRKALRVFCIENDFGAYLTKTELSSCFIQKGNKL